MRAVRPVVALILALSLSPRTAAAKDVGKIDGSPFRMDVTETSLLNWHGDNLNTVKRIDDNYGEWINRFNVLFAWRSWQLGLRLDTAKYWNEPRLDEFGPDSGFTRAEQRDAQRQLPYRYRDTLLTQGGLYPGRDPSIFPSKLFVSYLKPKFELTLGDAYVAFGRGFVLNIRKFDEIGADTTVQGNKGVLRAGIFTWTWIVGLSNPTRVDDATGMKLADAPTTDFGGDGCQTEILESNIFGKKYCDRVVNPYRQTWSRDLVAGTRGEFRVKTSTLGVHVANVRRQNDLFPGGDPTFVRDVTGVGASFAMPKVSDAVPLNVYTEVALQNRSPFPGSADQTTQGYAAYAALSLTTGPVTTSLEGKHYRSFYPVRLNADKGLYGAFQAVQYTANPTVELITQDSLFDNSCTTGGRARFDVKAAKNYTLFASGGRFANWGISCGAGPTLGITETLDTLDRHDITDLYTGFDLRSTTDTSSLTVMMGVRRENKALPDGGSESYYREGWLQVNGSKTLTGLWSVEVDAWHRNRYLNLEQWREGQTYLAIKYTSKYSLVWGHEYSTRPSQISPLRPDDPNYRGTDLLRGIRFLPADGVQHFLNVGGQIRFNDAIMLRVLFGEQRAALKCVSGVCRFFPAFAGARTELIIRY